MGKIVIRNTLKIHKEVEKNLERNCFTEEEHVRNISMKSACLFLQLRSATPVVRTDGLLSAPWNLFYLDQGNGTTLPHGHPSILV